MNGQVAFTVTPKIRGLGTWPKGEVFEQGDEALRYSFFSLIVPSLERRTNQAGSATLLSRLLDTR